MMKYLGLISIFILSLFSTAHAGEITRHSFYSEVLERDYEYSIYLPDGYEDRSDDYPAIYLLHGSLVDELSWHDMQIDELFDSLIASGRIPPVVAIMPTSRSWWVDGFNEPAETAFMVDLIPQMESRWRISPKRKDRIIGGFSAGGYGTVNFVLKYPELFLVGLAFAPASYADLPPENSSSYGHPTYTNEKGEFDAETWRRLNYPAFIDAYKAQDIVTPLFIHTGDHDGLDIAYHGAILYQQLRDHQPDAVEFRVVDGDHEPRIWLEAMPEALDYAFCLAGYKAETETP